MSAGAGWTIGTAVLGRPAYLNTGSADVLPADRTPDAMRENMFAVLDAAEEAGIDWIDTARSYGRAEEFLGGWLAARAAHPRETPWKVSSKWGYAYVGDWRRDASVHEVKEHSRARFREQWQQTRRFLDGTLTLYQVHSLTEDSPLFSDAGVLADLAELSAAGVAVGFSTSGPRQAEAVRRAADLSVDGKLLFSTVQSTWNVLDPSVGAALGGARASGMTVLLKECLANGRLVTDVPAAVDEMAARHGVGADAIALAAARAQPFADRVLLGPADPDQLRSNLRATEVQLSPSELGTLRTLAEDPDVYWGRRAELPWQ